MQNLTIIWEPEVPSLAHPNWEPAAWKHAMKTRILFDLVCSDLHTWDNCFCRFHWKSQKSKTTPWKTPRHWWKTSIGRRRIIVTSLSCPHPSPFRASQPPRRSPTRRWIRLLLRHNRSTSSFSRSTVTDRYLSRAIRGSLSWRSFPRRPCSGLAIPHCDAASVFPVTYA